MSLFADAWTRCSRDIYHLRYEHIHNPTNVTHCSQCVYFTYENWFLSWQFAKVAVRMSDTQL